MTHPLVMAMTGASGAIYAARLLQVLAQHSDRQVIVTISRSGATVIREELGVNLDLRRPDWSQLWPAQLGRLASSGRSGLARHMQEHPELWELAGGAPRLDLIRYVHYEDYMAPIASGSFLTSGMVIVPCSGSTLSSIVRSGADNLIHRAAEVHFKERRKLVVVPRETPVSQSQLENMARASQLGAVVLPAMPGWYHGVHSLVDLVDFVVARILDQFEVPHQLMRRWGEPEERPGAVTPDSILPRSGR
ncbi:MAG: UbiX family flavin prenyltransferase [Pirellulales bacterium]